MGSDQPCTPSDDEVRESFVIGQTRDGYGADWDDLIPEAREEFARWLAAHDARVRRDAARGALDGLADHTNLMAQQDHWRRMYLSAAQERHVAHRAIRYRDTHYPEETP